MHSVRPVLSLLLCALVWAAPKKSALDRQTLEAYIRHLFAWGPQISVSLSDPKPSRLPGFQEVTITASAGQASQQETVYISNDGRHIVRGVVYDVTQSPFHAEQEKITLKQQPTLGPAEALVKVVVFSDFQCSYCRELAQTLRSQLMPAYPKEVRLVFKDLPLEQIHPWARTAALAGRCVFRQSPDDFWRFHDWVFENQDSLTAENFQARWLDFAKAQKWDTLVLANCLASKSTEAEVERSMAEARSLNITSTPTLFINGRRLVGTVPWPQLKQLIDHELEYARKHPADGCCEVTLAPTGKGQ